MMASEPLEMQSAVITGTITNNGSDDSAPLPPYMVSSSNAGVSSTSTTTTTTTTRPVGKAPPYRALWEMDGTELDKWIQTVPAMHGADKQRTDALVDLRLATQVWANLTTALKGLTTKEVLEPPVNSHDNNNSDDDDAMMDEDGPSSKRVKLENGSSKKKKRKPKKKKIKLELLDPFNLYVHTIRKNEEDQVEDQEDDDLGIDPVQEAADELKTTSGGKLTQLTVSGILNGLSGVPDGIVTNKQFQTKEGSSIKSDSAIATAADATFGQLKHLANSVHQAIQTRVESDVLVTTPIRIQEMLAHDLTNGEFKAIRKRIYETVILGKGLAQPEELDIPTAASSGVHDIEKFKKCKSCGNNDQSIFVLDKKNGDVICSNCGTVASESLMHEGSAYRKFEGEADRNHHGDTANPLYSNAHNMSTTLGGVQMTTGAGRGGFGTQKRGLETVLRNAHAYTELNISQFGKGDRRTRTGYKDKQKKDAFMQMAHCGDALNLHEAVVQRAKEVFAGFRDDRELVQQFKGVIAACLCEAFEQLSSAGRQILKQKQEAVVPQETFNNARATRRNELHHANLAGKGGLLLDFSANQKEKKEGASSVSERPAVTWDLEDTRSWLMEASRSIAQQWIQDRKNNKPNIPDGTQEELEGNLVEHAITLNDALEAQLNQQANKQNNGRGRVITPRVSDMAKLGIKWQHGHERGSGGKGGVGGSGVHPTNQKGGRTAGQILILKTEKKLGLILKDNFAGRAIHKELRSLVSKQEAQKRSLQLQETTRQRFAQMKRKPWLQARAQLDS